MASLPGFAGRSQALPTSEISSFEAARLKVSDPLIVAPIACRTPNLMPQVKRRENTGGHPRPLFGWKCLAGPPREYGVEDPENHDQKWCGDVYQVREVHLSCLQHHGAQLIAVEP